MGIDMGMGIGIAIGIAIGIDFISIAGTAARFSQAFEDSTPRPSNGRL